MRPDDAGADERSHETSPLVTKPCQPQPSSAERCYARRVAIHRTVDKARRPSSRFWADIIRRAATARPANDLMRPRAPY